MNINNLNRHLQDNVWLYIITVLCMCIGIVLGIYSVKYMGDFQKSNLTSYLVNFSQNFNADNLQYKLILIEALKNNVPIILIVWFLGLTIVGIPIILFIDILKGFTLGFTMSIVIKSMGIKGIWFDVLGVIPQNIVYVPCIIVCSVIAMQFSIIILKNNSGLNWRSTFISRSISYSGVFFTIFIVMSIGFLLETYITPNMLKLIC